MSGSLRPHGLQAARLLCPWHFSGKNTGMGCHFLLHGIFQTQGSNLRLRHFRWSPASHTDSSPLSQLGTAQMILQGATPPCPGPSECCVSFSQHEPVPGKVVITWLPKSWPLEGVWVSYSPLRPQHLGPYQMLNTRAERTH